MAGRIAAWTIGAALIALYAWLAVAAVGNIVGLWQMAEALGLGMTPIGWFWLSFGVGLPVVVLALALLLGRRRGAGARLLVLAAGLALVAAVQLEVLHLVPRAGFFA